MNDELVAKVFTVATNWKKAKEMGKRVKKRVLEKLAAKQNVQQIGESLCKCGFEEKYHPHEYCSKFEPANR